MKNTPHLQRSNAPIREGVAVTICGKKIDNAVLLALDSEVQNPRDYLGLCGACFAISAEPGIKYEGVVVDGKYLDPKPPKVRKAAQPEAA
jgi:hypothetical protein